MSAGYEGHPAYWVTWIGAATLAAWHGARLPTRAELIKLTGRAPATAGNAGAFIASANSRIVADPDSPDWPPARRVGR